jgi:hypothetical protein
MRSFASTYVFVGIFALAISSSAMGGGAGLALHREQDGLAHILSSMVILKDSRDPDVRIILTSDSGECDPNREAFSCPKSQLLISVAEDAEGPQSPVVWSTPRRIGWQFVRWLHEPAYVGNTLVIDASFEADACEAPPVVESGKVNPRKGGWWRKTRYLINVSQKRGTMVPLNGYKNAPVCDLY